MRFAAPAELGINIPGEIQSVIHKCLEVYPFNRPDSTKLLSMMKQVAETMRNGVERRAAKDKTIDESIEEMKSRRILFSVIYFSFREDPAIEFEGGMLQSVIGRTLLPLEALW